MPDNHEQQLPGTTHHLQNAIHALIGLRHDTTTLDDGTTHPTITQSVYNELLEAINGIQGEAAGKSVARSKAPLWVGALSLADVIQKRVREWCPENVAGDHDVTVNRLYALSDASWRPQDVPLMRRYAKQLEIWVEQVEEEVNGGNEHRWEVTAACPSCSVRFQHRQNASGETVRTAVLQLSAKGCSCIACGANWQPAQFEFLATVLDSQAASDISTGNALEVR